MSIILLFFSCAIEPLPLFVGEEGVLYEAGAAVTDDTAEEEEEDIQDTAAEEHSDTGTEPDAGCIASEEDSAAP